MNKTVTANISGIIFHIETEAYEKLNRYLRTIESYFDQSDGKDEIMADIESRIAELFKTMEVDVINMKSVDEVIEVMGQPEQYMEAEDDSDNSKSETENHYKSKKLFRDPDDNLIGGVCAGLEHYFGLDKIWFRAAFLIAFFAGFGSGVIIYLILWIIVPAPKTTAEKLEMKGEPVNVDSIGNTIKNEFNSFKKKVNKEDAKKYGKKAENTLYRVFDFLIKLIVFIVKFAIKLVAALLVIAALIALFSLIGLFFGGSFMVNIFNYRIDQHWVSDYADIIFSSELVYYLGYIGLGLFILIPLLGIIYGGLKMIFKLPNSNKAIGLTAVSLWIIGIILTFFSAATTVSQFATKQEYGENISLPELTSDTITVEHIKPDNSGMIFTDEDLFIKNDSLYLQDFDIDIVKSNSNQIELYVRKSARGNDRKEAGKRAKNVQFNYHIKDQSLQFSHLIAIPIEDKYRKQKIELSIGLPQGKTIYLENSSKSFIYDIKNLSNTYDGDMIGHHWLMTSKGLKCVDCEWLNNRSDTTTAN